MVSEHWGKEQSWQVHQLSQWPFTKVWRTDSLLKEGEGIAQETQEHKCQVAHSENTVQERP